MSRSYRRNHFFKTTNPGAKKYANKRVRQALKQAESLVFTDGNHYRKHTEPYNIADQRFDCSFEEFLKWGGERVFDSPQEALAEWERMWHSK